MDKILRCTVLQYDSPSAAADRGRDVLVRRGGSEKNDPRRQSLALSCFENLNPCQAGHRDVEDGDVGFECADRLEGSGPVALRVDDLKTGNSSQECLKPAQDDGVVVGEQNAQRAAAVHHAGNSTLISVPCELDEAGRAPGAFGCPVRCPAEINALPEALVLPVSR